MTDELFPDQPTSWDVDAARAELRVRFDGLRSTPGFPIGGDDQILQMSAPPFHTACPNPFINDWLDQQRGTTDDDRPDPGPFVTDISAGKGSAVYKAHSYPTKVPHQAIMRFLLHYTRPGDVVLDGFAGSGSTGVAAQACGHPDPETKAAIEAEMGPVAWGYRRAVLSDLSPSASVIAAGLNLPVDAHRFDVASKRLLDRFDAEYGWMYETTHTTGKTARIDYVIWSQVFTCPSCGAPIVFYDVAYVPTTGRVSDDFNCSSCGSQLTKDQAERRMVKIRTVAGDTIERIELRPVRVVYRYAGQVHEKPIDDDDLARLRRVASTPLPGPVPTQEIPFMHMTHERAPMPKKGFTHVHHLWGDRALIALSALWTWAAEEPDPLTRLALRFWIEQAFWGLSWQNRHKPLQHGRLGGSAVNNYMSGVYYVPSIHDECSLRYNLEGSRPAVGKRQSLVKLWRASAAQLGNVVVSTGSSTSLDIPDDSVDYVFVDPPFGSNIYYADLAYLVEAWYGVFSNPDAEAIVNESRVRTRTLGEYGTLMAACFSEFFRALKPGRWMTVEFSNSKNEVWLAVQRALEHAGFVVADTRILDKEQLSYRQVTAASAAKKDLVISCYKPSHVVPDRAVLGDGDPETAWAFVREHLERLPVVDGRRGQARTIRERMADRLYDRMVSFHVSRRIPVPVTTSECYAGLEQRFPVRDGMHFLDDQVETYERHRITIKELLGAELFITGESSAVQWLRQLLKAKGRPMGFSEIQPAFLQELQIGLPDWEAMPELLSLLEENFLQDDHGRWYVPDPRKAGDLEKLRRRALLREFEAYTTGTSRLTRFRTEAIRTGFDAAWDAGNYAMILKVGKRLPADVLLEDPALRLYVDNAEVLAG